MNTFVASDKLSIEASAFDRQIEERIANGHVPDLRLSKSCDYFYNNAWRRPEFVKLDFGEQFELIRDAISRYIKRDASSIRVLEVGCGPGYLCLELARSGFQVVGLDLSAKCIDVAMMHAESDPWRAERGSLSYILGDYYTNVDLEMQDFDAVVFLGALHHFPEQATTLERAKKLLRPGGLIIVHEPVRDRVTHGHAVFALLLSTLLSLNSNFYQTQPLATDSQSIKSEVDRIFGALRYEREDGVKLQSINDNEAGYAEMYPLLSHLFRQEHFEWRYAFFHEFIGGLRFDEGTNFKVAMFLKEIDRLLVDISILPATEFFYVGRKD